MDELTSLLMTLGPLALGGVLAVPYTVWAHASHVHATMFGAYTEKLLVAGNGSRALKLSMAAPRAPICGATRAALQACREGVPQGDAAGDYRTGAADSSPDAVLARIRACYDTGFDATNARVRAARWVALAATVALVATIVLHVVLDAAPLGAAIAAAAALVVLGSAARADLRTLRARNAVFSRLAPHFYRAAITPGIFDGLPAGATTPVPRQSSDRRAATLALDVYEPGGERRLVPCDRDVFKIGTIETSHLRLSAPGVTRLHAVIERSADGPAYVIDLGARPQTRVNGEPVTRRELGDGDVITVGEAELRVVFGAASAP